MANLTLSVPDLQRHGLSNGLQLLFQEDHTIPVVATTLWYRVGSGCERPGRRGVSHFLEHMMFKGAGRFAKGEIDAVTTRLGGANNAFTSLDYTAYYFTFSSDRWETALEIEAARMRDNLFDPEEFALEKQVVMEEIKMDLDSPWGGLLRAVELGAFARHPYKYPVIGLEEDLDHLTVEQMIEHYRHYYAPNNALLAVVGDFEPRQALRRVEELFGAFETEAVPPRPPVTEPVRRRQVRIRVCQQTRVPRLMITLPAPPLDDPAHLAVQIADKVLSEGKLARLYTRLVEEEKLLASFYTEFFETRDPYLFVIRAELLEGADPCAVEAGIFDELEAVRCRPLEEEELERARNQCRTELLAQLETPLDRAIQFGLMDVLEVPEFWPRYLDRLESIRGEDVMAMARRYWTAEQATVGILTAE